MTTTTESKTINFDNGYGIYYDADDIGSANALVEMVNRHWDDIVAHMDRDIAESVHEDMAPCTNAEFLAEYLRRAHNGIVIG